jgi:hypothetical protein
MKIMGCIPYNSIKEKAQRIRILEKEAKIEGLRSRFSWENDLIFYEFY